MSEAVATASILTLDSVDVFYGSVQALFDVSLTVARGETVVILGGNASGKSTTLKSVLGFVNVTKGEIQFEGRSTNGIPPHEMIRLGLASIPEGRRMFSEMTVLDNLKLGAYSRRGDPPAQLRDQVEEALAMFPRLAERQKQTAGTMSGGEQQMLAMARAWMRKPKLLCIDEPSMGLSPLLVDAVYDILAKWKANGLTILMVEQNANMALTLADRAYVLKAGRIAVSGRASELTDNEDVKRAYLGG